MGLIEVEQDGIKRKVSSSYLNRVSPYPDENSLTKSYVIDRYLVHGFMPEKPFVSKDTPIVSFGSCFASNINEYLHDRGYNILTRKSKKYYVTRMGDGVVHTAAIRQQFEWAWEGRTPSIELWNGYTAEDFGYSDDMRLDTKALFDEAEVFIITLGLSEIWYDEPTGEAFWRVPSKAKMDPTRHKFRVATVAETKENLRVIRSLIAKHRPDASVVVTISPIPMSASFRSVACLSANAASKAIIRAAVDEFYRETTDNDPNLYYFPSYDIVLYAFDNQFMPDRRHLNPEVINFNLKVFEHYFCSPGIEASELLDAFRSAQKIDKQLAGMDHQGFTEHYAEMAQTYAEVKEKRKDERKVERAARIEARRLAKRGVDPTLAEDGDDRSVA